MSEKITIIYADDDQDDLEFFQDIVESFSDKYEVITCMDGLQLMSTLESPPHQPYMLFLDINMPKMNGIEVLKQLRSSEKYCRLPVIMFSTTDDSAMVAKTFELGANYYVPKSSHFKELRKSIEHSLQINWESFIPSNDNFLYHSN